MKTKLLALTLLLVALIPAQSQVVSGTITIRSMADFQLAMAPLVAPAQNQLIPFQKNTWNWGPTFKPHATTTNYNAIIALSGSVYAWSLTQPGTSEVGGAVIAKVYVTALRWNGQDDVANNFLSTANTDWSLQMYENYAATYGDLTTAKSLNDRRLALPNADATAVKTDWLSDQAINDINVNAGILTLLSAARYPVPTQTVGTWFSLFSTQGVSSADILAFYNSLLKVVELNPKSAQLVAKIIDQKNKLSQ